MTLTTAWKMAGTGANSSTGNTVWLNPTRITAEDASYAGGEITNASDNLLATNFGFTTSDVPLVGIVTGVNVRVKVGVEESVSSNVYLRSNGGNSIGFVTQGLTLLTPTKITYSQSLALWDITPDIYSSGWGCFFNAQKGGAWDIAVDCAEMQLEYVIPIKNQVVFIG